MKQKLVTFFDKLMPFFDKLGTNPYLQAISGAMMATLGPAFIGSISVLLIVFINMLPNAANLTQLITVLSKVNAFTIGSLALYIAILMAVNIVRKLDENEDYVAAGIISVMCFLLITPLEATKDGIPALATTWLSAQGVFSAMIVGISVGILFLKIKSRGWTIKMPDGVPPMVTRMFESLIPTILIAILFIIIDYLFNLTTFGSMHQFIYSIVQKPLQGIGGSIGAMILLSLLQQILWFFGIHGTNVILPIVTPIWMAMDIENLNAITAGQTPPNILGLAFFNIITFGGMALGLVLLMLRAKSKQYQEIAKISIVPSLFGITEPVIFGMPLVLNFDLAIPFIFNNTIALLLAYVLTKIGIVANFIGVQAIFGLPVGFHAAVQGSLSIILLQLGIQFILSPLLWYPWFKRLDKKAYALEQATLND